MRLGGAVLAQHVPGMAGAAQKIREWMQSVVDAGLTVAEWSRRSKVAKSTIFRAMKPDYQFTTSSSTLSKLAQAAKVAAPDLGGLVEDATPTLREIMLPVRYEVAAGAWLKRDELLQEVGEPVLHPAIEDPRYVGVPQWLERVKGDSYNRRVPDGALVHVIDAIAIEYQPTSKDTVVVQRTRLGGIEMERTLKEVRLAKGQILLHPRSYNEKWADPINFTKGMGDPEYDEVRIVGLVIRAYIGFDASEDD